MLKKNPNMRLEYAIIGVMIFLVGSVLGLIAYDPEFVIQPQSGKTDMLVSESVISFQKEAETKPVVVEKIEISMSEKVTTTKAESEIQEKVVEKIPPTVIPEPIVEEQSLPKASPIVSKEISAVKVEVTIPDRAMYLGCEETRKCYMPSEVMIQSGNTIVWYNDDVSAHTVTSGNPLDGPDGIFDSGLFLADTTFSYTFEESGEYQYYCIVHPWMTGTIFVS